MKLLIAFILSFGLYYLMFFFFTGEVNPLNWNIFIKIIVVIFTFATYNATMKNLKGKEYNE